MQENDSASNICLGFWGFLNTHLGSKFTKKKTRTKTLHDDKILTKTLLSQPYTQEQGSILSIACLNIPEVTPKWGSKKSAKTAKNANFCQN